jgi:hypothetical protein
MLSGVSDHNIHVLASRRAGGGEGRAKAWISDLKLTRTVCPMSRAGEKRGARKLGKTRIFPCYRDTTRSRKNVAQRRLSPQISACIVSELTFVSYRKSKEPR